MKINCSNCEAEINPGNINVSTDLVKCQSCGSILKLSELTNSIRKEKLTPPIGSKITMNKKGDNHIEFTYPNKGITVSMILLFIFAIFWIGFASVWTIFTLNVNPFFALFSIPFGFLGINFLIGCINAVTEYQILVLEENNVTVKRIRLVFSKTIEVNLTHIRTIKMIGLKMSPFTAFGNIRLMMKMQNFFGGPIEVPAILTGKKTEYFFEEANDAEQEWISLLLSELVNKANR